MSVCTKPTGRAGQKFAAVRAAQAAIAMVTSGTIVSGSRRMNQMCCSQALSSVSAAQARLELAPPIVYDDRLRVAKRIHHEEAAVGRDVPTRVYVPQHVISLEELLPVRDVHVFRAKRE